MMLLTKETIAALPPLRSQDGKDARQVPVVVKFFTPDSSWTWYAIEGEKIDGDWRFFGLVVGMETELGYWSLNELAGARGPLGLPIERDRHFRGKTLYDVLIAHGESSLAEALGPGRDPTDVGVERFIVDLAGDGQVA